MAPSELSLLRSPRIDSKELIPPAYVASRAGTTTLCLLDSYSPYNMFLKFQHSSLIWFTQYRKY